MRLHSRVARLEAARTDQRPEPTCTPEKTCASCGYTLEQAVAEFGSFPNFCYAMMIRPDPTYTRPEGDLFAAYFNMLRR